jgi:zinc protease
MKLRLAALFSALVLTVSSLAQTSAIKAPTIAYEEYRLPNGLQVLLTEDKSLPLVSVNVWYHVGAVNERPGRTGFAHLFEHMMFEGSKNVGEKNHFKYLEAAGASDINGSTNFDRTNYFETVPSNQLELALWLESDRMGFLLDTLDRAKLTNQRDVVRNERRQSRENQPYGVVEEEVYGNLFPEPHPYHGVVIGSHKDIEAARLVDVRDFFKTYYAPNNATLVVAGSFDKAQAKALVEKYFGPLQKGEAVPKLDVVTPSITAEKRMTVSDTVQLEKIYLAWLSPKAFAPGDAEMDITADVLGGGRSSRLYKKLVYEQQIAQAAQCYNESAQVASIFNCEITARPGTKAADLEKAANAVIDEFLKNGATSEELERARTKSIAGLIRPLERIGFVADKLNYYNHFTGDPGYLPKDIARYQNADGSSVMKYAQDLLASNHRVVIYGVPGEKVIHDIPRSPENTDADVKIEKEYTADFDAAQAWRKTAPKPGPTPVFSLPVPQTFTLANGLKVYVAESHKLPLFAANLVSLSGASQDPADKPGVAGFAAAMLTEGTKTRSATVIADQTGDLALSLNGTATSDAMSVSVGGLTTKLDNAVDLFADVALHPAFDGSEVERVRKRRLTQLLQQRDQPPIVAQQVGAAALFGPTSAYGHNSLGKPDSVKEISSADLSGFYTKNVGPKNSALVLSGDITLAKARALATKYFGGWTGTASVPAPPTAPAAATKRVILVDKPGAPQTALYAFQLGLPRSTPDYVPVVVMNTMLGDLFSSRINMNLREEHGYTYGASSRFTFRRGNGPFLAGASVRTDVTAPAAKELVHELTRIRTEPLSDSELKMARDSYARSLPGDFETNAGVVGAMGNIFTYDLPLTYYRALPAKIDAVTSKQAADAATTYIHPDQMILVAVGDKAKIEAGLKELNLAPIEEWTVDATPKQ